jgi:hypothetical protein
MTRFASYSSAILPIERLRRVAAEGGEDLERGFAPEDNRVQTMPTDLAFGVASVFPLMRLSFCDGPIGQD